MIHTFTDEVYQAIIEITAGADGEISDEEVARKLQLRGLWVSPRVVRQCLEVLEYDPQTESD
jgi:repressor of nif and glnA expression